MTTKDGKYGINNSATRSKAHVNFLPQDTEDFDEFSIALRGVKIII